MIKLLNEWKLILKVSILTLFNPFLLFFILSLFGECLSESACHIKFPSSPNVLFKQHLLYVLAHNVFLKIEIRLMLILHVDSAFFNLT